MIFKKRQRTKAEKEQRNFDNINTAATISDVLAVFILLCGFLAVFLGASNFYSGLHNVDLSYNYQNIAFKLDPITRQVGVQLYGADEVMDINSDFQERTLTEGYINGLNYMKEGLLYMAVAGACFVMGVFLFMHTRISLLYEVRPYLNKKSVPK